MILRTKEERIEFLKNLDIGYYRDWYMLKETDIEKDSFEIIGFRVEWAWSHPTWRKNCEQGELIMTEIKWDEVDVYNGSQKIGSAAYEYVQNYIWADSKLELEEETKKYNNALTTKESVIDWLSL